MIPEGFDMGGLMAQATAMKAQFEQAQAEIAATELEGSAGGGLVTAVVTGTGELKQLTISPEVVDPEDVETLSDLIVAAVRDANSQVAALTQAKLGPLAGGLGGLAGGLGL